MHWHAWSLSQGLLHLEWECSAHSEVVCCPGSLEQGDTFTTGSSFSTSHTPRGSCLAPPTESCSGTKKCPCHWAQLPSGSSSSPAHQNWEHEQLQRCFAAEDDQDCKNQSQALLSAGTAAKQQGPDLQRHGTVNSLLHPLRTQDHIQVSPPGFPTSSDGCRLNRRV